VFPWNLQCIEEPATVKTMVFIRIKNTFLEFQDEDPVTTGPQRSKSLPPRVESCNVSPGSQWTLMSQSEVRVPSTGTIPFEQVDKKALYGKRNPRPCKAKRFKFKHFVETLKMKLLHDPDSFSLCRIKVPKDLVWDDRTQAHVAKILADCRKQLVDFHMTT